MAVDVSFMVTAVREEMACRSFDDWFRICAELGAARRFAFGPMAVLFSVITVVLILLSTMFGGMRIPLADWLPSLFQSDGLFSALIQLRIPRTLVAAGAGAALAISGVLIQMAGSPI